MGLRPLLQAVPRRDGERLVLDQGYKRITIEGNVELACRLVSLCDGMHTLDEIVTKIAATGDAADAVELLGRLVREEVISDCTRAWRRFHRESSVDSGLYRPIDDDELAVLAAQRFRPASLTGHSRQLAAAGGPLSGLLGRRRSARPGDERAVDFPELCKVVEAMYAPQASGARPVPSAGGLYPLVIHVLARRELPPLEAGLWWLDPLERSLELVRDDGIEVDGLISTDPYTGPLLSRGHPVVFISADLDRMSRKYSNRGYRFALMEAGAAMQNAYLAATEAGIPLRAAGGVVERRLHGFLALPGDVEPLLALLLGA